MSLPLKDSQNQVIGNYQILDRIGLGAFGSVHKGIHIPSKSPVAIKMMQKFLCNTEENKKEFLNEVNVLKSLRHPLVAEFYDLFESDNHFYIVMEHCPNGSLHDLIAKYQKLDETIAIHISSDDNSSYLSSFFQVCCSSRSQTTKFNA